MKTAIIIDQEKIKKLKKKVATSDYMEKAIAQLAHEISFIFS